MQTHRPVSRSKRRYHIVVFLAPAVIVYTVFMIIPLIDSLRLSFFTITPDNKEIFNGVQNYVTLLTNPQFADAFKNALGNDIKFFLVHMIVQNSIGVLLAALLASPGRGRGIYRTLIFMPTVLSVVLIGFIWQLILNPLWGVSEGILKTIGLGALYKPWLGQEPTALLTLSLISVWQFVGIPMLLFYVALIGIPEELIEAARVDGPNSWGIFWRVKFPLILPTVGTVGILTFLEGDALRRAQKAIAANQPSVVTYDTTRDDHNQIGVGLGCNGIIDVLFTPLDPSNAANPISLLRDRARSREPRLIATITGCDAHPQALGKSWPLEDKAQWLRDFPLDRQMPAGSDAELAETVLADVISCLKSGDTQTLLYTTASGDEVRIRLEVLMPATHLVLYGSNNDIF